MSSDGPPYTKVLRYPASEDVRQKVTVSVDTTLTEVMGEVAWPALRKQLAKLYGLLPEDLVYDYDRFITSAGVLLGYGPTLILFPLVLSHLKDSFPGVLDEARSMEDVAKLLQDVDPSIKVQSAVMERTKFGDHIMLLYDTLDMKERVLTWFYKGAIERNHLFVLITGSPDRSTVTGDVFSRGLPVGSDAGRSELMSVRDALFHDYVFDPRSSILKIREIAEGAKKKGFRGARIVLDSGGLMRYGEEGGLALLEAGLGIRTSMPAVVMCAYDVRGLTDKDKLRARLLDSHGLAIVPEKLGLSRVDYGPPGQRKLS